MTWLLRSKISNKLLKFVSFKKQPAPSTLKNSLGRIIGSNKSISTPIIRRNLFQNTPSTPITPFNTDNYIYNNTEINHQQKDHPEVTHNHGKTIPTESLQSDRFATIRNPYTGNNIITDKMRKTTSRIENHTDKVDHGNEKEKDQLISLQNPQTSFFNTPTQFSSPQKTTQKSIKSILQNKVQISNVSTKKLILPPELETLRTVILSQHNALAPHIQELGNICLQFTKLIESKKESSAKLHQGNRIPRSLRVKCELSTSQDYENNPDFLKLKQTLQNIVSNFTTQGLEVMKEWSFINIKLLVKDRCLNILKKALSILDGLQSYWTDILHPIDWPSDLKKQNLLLLTKIFFTTDFYPNIDDIIEFLELSPEEIMLLISKILNHQNTEDSHHINLINSIDLTLIEKANEKQLSLITETLTSFEQILQATTTDLWSVNLQKNRELEASQKLQAKMEADRFSTATANTAKAIDKAVEKINEDNDLNKNNQLRLQNLEKQAAHHKQLALEILNHVKAQKNLQRGQHGSLTSHQNNKNPFHLNTFEIPETIDLTTSQSQSPVKNSNIQSVVKKRKHIHWDDGQTQTITFHPMQTSTQMFGQSKTMTRHQIQPHSMFTATPPQTPNPFLPPHQQNHQRPQSNQKNQKYRGGRTRGGRRGYSQR